ncbi:RNA methyltransferase, TrmH family, group 1 [Luminiphilus syltensis NOR5-1B]|uniref:tRNA (cytidine/uridine-2'-O-)-methyltransferase TrmJ n=1 Tax=Luminiphilus syltensis NOR5-1B TaxID=565045 RepID=B8KXG9_9GAMM|nr:RNA methyltransferase [Luminiphilus syltensis]EED34986.1 RNA methyltransferase, TrmH family, group 1 [Luminiphilus syltensis NOR5-1B]
MNTDNIEIVLVHTSSPGNIGGAARAMKNMGLSRLTLVAPREFPAPEATWRAASASDVLNSARIVDSVDEAIADSQFVVGTSARGRRIPWPVLDPRRCAERLAVSSRTERVAILFGREDRGLTNEELQRCNLHCHIPSHEDYSSLNLAMAVQIVAYELRMWGLAERLPEAADEDWDVPFVTTEEMTRFYRHLEETLTDIGFLDPAAPRQLMPRLARLFNRVRIDDMEMGILRGILTEAQKSAGKH